MIDAHAHVWVIDPLRYPWAPIGGYVPQTEAPVEQLLEVMDAAGVDLAVLVQPTPYGWDNAYLFDSARRYTGRFALVCLLDPLAERSSKLLASLYQGVLIHGLRINWHLQPLQTWQNSAAHWSIWSRANTLDMPICLQLTPPYLELAAQAARSYPRVKVVIDHLGRPEKGSTPLSPFFRQLLSLQQYPNVYVKLSGLNYASNQAAPYADVWPLVGEVVAHFGAPRCMWGSDFPFIREHWDYDMMLKTVQENGSLSAAELEWVLDRTARSVWW